jgi:parallel beta-helix repeat protein
MLNTETGILITESASYNYIINNQISGCKDFGIVLEGAQTTSNFIENNNIGLNGSGTSALPNEYGINIRYGANNNTIYKILFVEIKPLELFCMEEVQ